MSDAASVLREGLERCWLQASCGCRAEGRGFKESGKEEDWEEEALEAFGEMIEGLGMFAFGEYEGGEWAGEEGRERRDWFAGMWARVRRLFSLLLPVCFSFDVER